MADLYEFAIWAEGYATDEDGNMLDAQGNPIEDTKPESEEVQQEETWPSA